MNVLALDSSQIQAAISLVVDDKLVATSEGSIAVSHSEALLLLIDRLLKQSQLTLDKIDAFGVGVGPGSFTGIRIGCATVKTLAQVLDKPIFPFSSLKALALSCDPNLGGLVAMANAYQGQVFVGWLNQNQTWFEDVMSAEEWCQKHGLHIASNLRFCGNGAVAYRSSIESVLAGRSIEFTESTLYSSAPGVARAIVGVTPVSYAQLQAHYMRRSQAEIKLEATVAKGKGA